MLDANRKSEIRYDLYHKDGLLDIFIGLGILFSSLFIRTDIVWMGAIYIPILFPSWKSARKRFIHRRVGKSELNPQLHPQGLKIILYFTLLLGSLVLAGVGLFFGFGLISGTVNAWLHSYFLIALGIVFASMWVFAAVVLKLSRFYIHAFFTFACLAASQFTFIPFWAALALSGSLTALVGLIVLIRFLQEHPIIKKGV